VLDELLAAWIGRQRWFGGKGRAIDDLSIDSDVELTPGLRHLIVAVWQEGSRDRYQLLLGESDHLPDRLTHAFIGTIGDRHLFDAVHDSDRMSWLLEGMARDESHNGLRMRHLPGVEIDTTQRSLVLGAEQSNTSLVYGDAYICKLFRRLIPGVNPELEIITALAARNAPHIAQPYGWIETDLDGANTTLAIMQQYLSNANDGWDLALTSVREDVIIRSLTPRAPVRRIVAATLAGGYRSAAAAAMLDILVEVGREFAGDRRELALAV